MLRIERSHDNAREAPVAIRETPRELHRPLSADATDDGFADEQLIADPVDVDLEMVPVAQIRG